MGRSLVVLMVLAHVASAQPRNEDKQEADRLFYEGRELLAKEKRAEACEKFDLSFRKDPRAVGTILNLGLCGEMSGKVATAVRYYAEARDRARDQDLKEYQEAAERKIALLSSRVPHLTITLAEDLPGTRVLVDSTVLAREQLTDVEVDPGTRTIVVTAPNRLPYETKIEIEEGKAKTIAIPKLEGARTVVVRQGTSPRRLWGKVAVGSGVAMIATGVIVGYLADKAYWSEFPRASRDGAAAIDDTHDCWTALIDERIQRQCNAAGQDALDDAVLRAHVGTGVAIAGAATLAAGVYLWLSAPEDRTVVTPVATPTGAGVSVTVRF